MANSAGLDDNSRRTLSALSNANDGTVVNLWADPTTHRLLVDNANTAASLTVGTTTISNGTTTKVLFDNVGVLGEYTISGTGNVAMTTSPVFTTPSLGVATASSLNGNTFTTGTYTLTGTAGKTLNFTNTLTLSGTDSTTMTFPATSATIARTDAANTFTGTQTIGALTVTTVNGNTITAGSSTYTGTAAQTYTFPTTTATIARTDAAQTFTGTQTFTNAVINTNNAIAASGNAATVPVTAVINTVTNNSAATLTITMATASAVNRQLSEVLILDSSAATQTITWVNTEDSTVTAPTTSNGSTTLPLSVLFQFNTATTKWRCISKA